MNRRDPPDRPATGAPVTRRLLALTASLVVVATVVLGVVLLLSR